MTSSAPFCPTVFLEGLIRGSSSTLVSYVVLRLSFAVSSRGLRWRALLGCWFYGWQSELWHLKRCICHLAALSSFFRLTGGLVTLTSVYRSFGASRDHRCAGIWDGMGGYKSCGISDISLFAVIQALIRPPSWDHLPACWLQQWPWCWFRTNWIAFRWWWKADVFSSFHCSISVFFFFFLLSPLVIHLLPACFWQYLGGYLIFPPLFARLAVVFVFFPLRESFLFTVAGGKSCHPATEKVLSCMQLGGCLIKLNCIKVVVNCAVISQSEMR